MSTDQEGEEELCEQEGIEEPNVNRPIEVLLETSPFGNNNPATS